MPHMGPGFVDLFLSQHHLLSLKKEVTVLKTTYITGAVPAMQKHKYLKDAETGSMASQEAEHVYCRDDQHDGFRGRRMAYSSIVTPLMTPRKAGPGLQCWETTLRLF
jgi:hypothetical protein